MHLKRRMQENDGAFAETAHRPLPTPTLPWRLRQRWSRLLFTHWPVPAADVQARLPRGLRVDTFDRWAWLGVVPFVMEQVRFRSVSQHSFGVPGARAFPELNLRTYVTGPDGRAGVYFFSLDAGSLLAVAGARAAFGLAYFWARMAATREGNAIYYRSERRLTRRPVRFEARYRPLRVAAAKDDLCRFVTERYALFVRRFGAVQIGEIHHRPWQLEWAEAEFMRNDLPGSSGFTLPPRAPVLHYSEEIEMEAWLPYRVRVSAWPSLLLSHVAWYMTGA